MLRCSIQRMKRFSPSGQHYPDPSLPKESGTEEVPQVHDGSKRVKTAQSFESLFDSETLCDVIINLNDGQFRFNGHKMIIGMKSEVLASLLNETGSMDTDERPLLCLHESDECSQVFSRFLYFIYSGAVWLHRDYVLPLHQLAEKYAVKSLSQHCESYISQILTNMMGFYENIRAFPIDTVCDMYENSNFPNEIRRLSLKVLRAKYKELVMSERWLRCPWNLVSDLIKCDDCAADENFILTSATDWMKKNSLSDKCLIENILINIRYPLLHKRVLYHLKKNSAFKNFPQVQALVENAMLYHCFKDLPEAKDDFVGLQYKPRQQTIPSVPNRVPSSENMINNHHTPQSNNHHRHNILNQSVLVQNNQPVNYGTITAHISHRPSVIQSINDAADIATESSNQEVAINSSSAPSFINDGQTINTSGVQTAVTNGNFDILQDFTANNCRINSSRARIPETKSGGFKL